MPTYLTLTEVWIDEPRRLPDGVVELLFESFPTVINMDFIFTMTEADLHDCHHYSDEKGFQIPRSIEVDGSEVSRLTKLVPSMGADIILVSQTLQEIMDMINPPKPKRGRPSKKKTEGDKK